MIRIHRILFYILLVFLPTQTGYHFWPAWTMILGRRVDYLSPTLYGTDIIVCLLLLSWFVSERKKVSMKNLFGRIRNISRPMFFIGVIFFVVLNIILATSPVVTVFKWIKILEFGALAWYVIKTKPKFSSVVPFFGIGVLYSSVIAITQFILQHSIGGLLWWLGERTFSNLTSGIAQINVCKPYTLICTLLLRAYGTFSHPNVLGGYIAISLPMMVSVLILHRQQQLPINKKILMAITWLAIILGTVALILTFSRSAWVIGILGLIGSLFIWGKKRLSVIRLAIIFIPIALIMATMINIQEESVMIRNELNLAALQQFLTSPFVGIGLGNFLVKLPEYLVSRQIYFLQPVHNIYLLILTETGIIGLGTFFFIIWHAVKNLSGTYHQNVQEKQIIKTSLFALLLLGLVDHYLLTIQQGQLLLTLLLAFSFI